VFGKVYFPESSALMGVLQAFGVFFVGFVGRPIGAAIFGHYGDRIGRKATLIATLLVTGIATFCVGLVPSYEQYRYLGCRSADVDPSDPGHRRRRRMGRLSSARDGVGQDQQTPRLHCILAPVRAPCGLFLANSAVLFFSWLSGDQFLVWGWRIPFFISIVMVGVGLWIRLGFLKPPVFQKILDEDRAETRASA